MAVSPPEAHHFDGEEIMKKERGGQYREKSKYRHLSYSSSEEDSIELDQVEGEWEEFWEWALNF